MHVPTRDKNTLDLILTSPPGQFLDIHSSDKLSDHNIVVGTVKETSEKGVFISETKDDYESMRKDAFEFAKEKYFNGYPDTRSEQENFNLITSLFKIRRINTSHPKLVGRSLRFPGLTPNKKEDSQKKQNAC